MFQLGNVLVIQVSGRRDFLLKKMLDAMDGLIDFGLAESR